MVAWYSSDGTDKVHWSREQIEASGVCGCCSWRACGRGCNQCHISDTELCKNVNNYVATSCAGRQLQMWSAPRSGQSWRGVLVGRSVGATVAHASVGGAGRVVAARFVSVCAVSGGGCLCVILVEGVTVEQAARGRARCGAGCSKQHRCT